MLLRTDYSGNFVGILGAYIYLYMYLHVFIFAVIHLHVSDFCAPKYRHIPNCSHWVQQDNPELVNQYMREFLSTEK